MCVNESGYVFIEKRRRTERDEMMEKQFNGKTKEDQINKTNYFCIMIEPAAGKRDEMRSFFSSVASDGKAKEKKSFPKNWGLFDCFVTSSYFLSLLINH